MKEKKILLINNSISEITWIRNLLDEMEFTYSLHVATHAMEALHVLMGSTEKQPRSRKVRPDVILVNEVLLDMSTLEFLKIIRTYYSLKSIKVFLLASAADPREAVFDKLDVNGYIAKPFNKNSFNILHELDTGSRAYLPMFSLDGIKARLFSGFNAVRKGLSTQASGILKTTFSSGTKVTLCAASLGVVSGAAIYDHHKRSADHLLSTGSSITIEQAPLQGSGEAVEQNKAAYKAPSTKQQKTKHKSHGYAAQPLPQNVPAPPDSIASSSEKLMLSATPKIPKDIAIKVVAEPDSTDQY